MRLEGSKNVKGRGNRSRGEGMFVLGTMAAEEQLRSEWAYQGERGRDEDYRWRVGNHCSGAKPANAKGQNQGQRVLKLGKAFKVPG